MNQSRATTRYAKALLELSIEKNVIESSYNDMALVDSTCLKNKELILLLKSPVIKTEKKLRILKQIFEKEISVFSMNFIAIIVKKNREALLPQIANAFVSQYKKHKNIQEAIVTTAIPLTKELKSAIIRYIKKNGEIEVELTEVVDKNIIGGAIIKIGDKQLDASVVSQISELRQMFNKNLYLQDF